MDKGTILKVTSALVGLVLVLFGGWLTMSEEAAHSELLIWAGLGLIGGGLGTAALPSALPGRKPPTDGEGSRPRRGTTPPLPVLLALALVTGCGATLDPVYAGIGQGALEVSVEAEPVIRASRAAAMRGAAERVHEAGGTIEEARDAVAAEASEWQCAVDGHRIFGAATSAYVDTLLLATSAGGLDLALVLRFVSPLATAGRALASCVESRGLALAMPFLDLIPASWGLTEVSDAAE